MQNRGDCCGWAVILIPSHLPRTESIVTCAFDLKTLFWFGTQQKLQPAIESKDSVCIFYSWTVTIIVMTTNCAKIQRKIEQSPRNKLR